MIDMKSLEYCIQIQNHHDGLPIFEERSSVSYITAVSKGQERRGGTNCE
jgi:hypothetical protein